MFLLDNIFIILTVTVILFVLFTYLNIATFSRGFITSIYLTLIFFDLFFKMPFKAVNLIYKQRERLLKKLEADKDLNDSHKDRMRKILEKRSRIFYTFYKAGVFSYVELMRNFTSWYKNRPFKVEIEVNLYRQKKKTYESKYLKDLTKDITAIEVYC